MNFFNVSAILTALFATLSMVDGVYLHLYKFKLHARAATRREHVIHGLRGLLFIPTLLLVLSGTTSGWMLWLGVGFVSLDVVITIVDVLEERGARDFQGGLPRYEFWLHVVLIGLHVGAVVTSLAARPAVAWAQTTSVHLSAAKWSSLVAVQGLLGGAVMVTLLHGVLLHPRFQIEKGLATP